MSRLKKESLLKFLKFLFVGAIGIVINEGLLYLLTGKAHMYYLLSGMVSIEASILSNFFLNDIWTFKDKRKKRIVVRLAKFNAKNFDGSDKLGDFMVVYAPWIKLFSI